MPSKPIDYNSMDPQAAAEMARLRLAEATQRLMVSHHMLQIAEQEVAIRRSEFDEQVSRSRAKLDALNDEIRERDDDDDPWSST
jgi:LPS O-antigen subunit length determinant protein (WzzB/FepE family)